MNLKHPHTITPKVLRVNFEEYNENIDDIQDKIAHYFPTCAERVRLICRGHHDPLTFLPEKILLDIASHLNLQDIDALSKVSLPLASFCDTDKAWENLYAKDFSATNMSDEMRVLADDIGWKKFYFSRVINTRRSTKR